MCSCEWMRTNLARVPHLLISYNSWVMDYSMTLKQTFKKRFRVKEKCKSPWKSLHFGGEIDRE